MSIELVLAADKIENLTGLLERCLPIIQEMASLDDDPQTEQLANDITEELTK